MARCGCASGSCSCLVTGAGGVTVAGVGSQDNPFVVTGPNLSVGNTTTVDLVLTGDGSALTPFKIVANAHLTLDALTDVSVPAPAAGNVLTWVTSPTPQWRAAVAQSGTPGAVLTDGSLSGAGTAGSALAVKLDPTGNISLGGAGLKVADGFTQCTSTTRPPSPTAYQRILETDTGAWGFWFPAPVSAWRMFDTRAQAYTPTLRYDTTNGAAQIGQGGYQRGWYMRNGQHCNVDFTIYLGGPGSYLGGGPLSIDLPFQVAGGEINLANPQHGGSGHCAGGWATWEVTPNVWPGTTVAFWNAPMNSGTSFTDVMRSADTSGRESTGVPWRPNAWPLQDGSWFEGNVSYLTV